jgi:quinol monooxygenase YgiN
MLVVIATMVVQPEKVQEFEAIFKEMTARVRATEPDTVYYQLSRSRTSPNTYTMLETYASQAAFDSHVAGATFQAAFPTFAPLLAEEPRADFLDGVV